MYSALKMNTGRICSANVGALLLTIDSADCIIDTIALPELKARKRELSIFGDISSR
jgi:hypothetical protein